jgi:serine/threonine protein kinase
MGIVYRVRRHQDGVTLALKMLLRGLGASFAELARFRIEAEALACLDHPNIIRIRDVGLHAGFPYFAMPFAAGASLRQVTARGPQKPRWAAEVVRTVALAMQHAHDRGMLHRDLKPANVLLMADGTPVVTDFGLVKFADPIGEVRRMHSTLTELDLFGKELMRFAAELRAQYGLNEDAPDLAEDEVTLSAWEQCRARTGLLGDGARLQSVRAFLSEAQQQDRQKAADLAVAGLTLSGTVMGSPSYMAPEQAAGDLARIGPRTDVYALGGILYELLTGQPPFVSRSGMDILSQVCSLRPTPPRTLVPDVSGDIDVVCVRCLEKLPKDRYQTAAALAEDLTRFIEGYSPHGLVIGEAPATVPQGEPGVQDFGWESLVVGETTATVPQGAETPHSSAGVTKSWWPFGRGRSNPSGS